ncbi:hypothetical protein Pisl_1271 [Pyrobaculum islandicum DSM 4184]|uniref:Uncharacterized protein n=1 Tax=Pyrobaculum islandicum (strain DSM 4184 / JCM 9189 / GEO3) TaxID=384616 RepID=A1RU03_PYRIL|nr:hypothetical protein [Pyrobaculum islandicum]ABL88435.1 hypothetical protein Pisl_1271 [Pyrobaculum islandicum DSM 4184]
MDELLLDGSELRKFMRELRRRGETLVVDGDMARRLSLAAVRRLMRYGRDVVKLTPEAETVLQKRIRMCREIVARERETMRQYAETLFAVKTLDGVRVSVEKDARGTAPAVLYYTIVVKPARWLPREEFLSLNRQLAALGLRYEDGAWRITFTRRIFRPHVC